MGDSNAPLSASKGNTIVLNSIADLTALNDLHRQLVLDLATLDQAGEHIVAAHLTAAIDALDLRLGKRRADMTLRNEGRLDTFVDGLIAKLGERALDVARRQLSDASGDALFAWAAIADRISARQACSSGS